jgi:hypothetical protein
MEKKRTYEKPELRRVRLTAMHSVLATCNTSVIDSFRNFPVPCNVDTSCLQYP